MANAEPKRELDLYIGTSASRVRISGHPSAQFKTTRTEPPLGELY